MTPSQCVFAQQITQNLNYQRKKTHKILGFLLRSGNLFLFFSFRTFQAVLVEP